MPEAPNNSPSSWASRGSSFSPSILPTIGAPLLTDYADLDAEHQGYSSMFSTIPTVQNGPQTQNRDHGGVHRDAHVHANRVSWSSDGPAMFWTPPMPVTTPGSVQSTTDDHRYTDVHQFPTNIIPESYTEPIVNMRDAITGVGALNSGSGSTVWMPESIAEPRTVNIVGGRAAHIPSLSDAQQTWSDMWQPFI
ncbi:hypothetical protein ASPTUDRAFT_196019 [Aspergillus tubingensis CBS 134.48]|uniref:Uncharacterized protein n=1 Tax=Aspergillus tubingensis (strain CBS 134.48) TaxID=767770 RepID=A0A1L9NGS1_ASPTC|nr:hypothetical protein ASPTUDRAFT_196019 [Aspergillus tubingensis CBS 134.48]